MEYALTVVALGGVEIALTLLAVVLVVVIALVSVGWAVGKTTSMPPQIVIDAEEAIEFCAEALPVEVTSVVTYDELRRLLRLHLEWIQAYHWAPEGYSDGPILFEELDAVDYMVERADTVDLDVSRDQIIAVIEAHSAYLQVAGAIHLEDPVTIETDLAELPILDQAESPSILDDPSAGSEG
ncbi:MAG: hypothetical protein OEV40_31270 [Acidimicrobiia bacterium]|nr:hypothetical protein [Acidimicrobiia bacterium]